MGEALEHRAGAELGLAAERERAARYAERALAPATLKAYATDWRVFGRWCAVRDLDALPASGETVGMFLADEAARGRRPSTVTRRAAAIARAHRAAHAPNPADTEPARAVLAGVRRTHGAAPARKLALVLDPLARALEPVDPATHTGRRDRALLLLGFAAALRRAELCALDVSDLEPTPRGLLVRLRRSKTDQEGHGELVGVPFAEDPALCPVRAVRAWLDGAAITTGPVFRRLHRGDTVGTGRLTPQSVALIVKRRAGAAGLPERALAGHSLRAGFITEAAEQGHHERAIANVSRHRSTRVLRSYVRRASAFDDSAKVL